MAQLWIPPTKTTRLEIVLSLMLLGARCSRIKGLVESGEAAGSLITVKLGGKYPYA